MSDLKLYITVNEKKSFQTRNEKKKILTIKICEEEKCLVHNNSLKNLLILLPP